jgi:DNA-binding SARP family transcriptional activator/ABC-type transport system substrate-binding protein/streptogramin lyase
VEFRLLGPVEALRDGVVVALGGAKPRALLALLLIQRNEVVSRDTLIEALWPDRPPGTAAHSLDVQISRLRKAFAPEQFLETRANGYVLEIEPEQIDVDRFEQLLERGKEANAAGLHTEALAAFEVGLDLWRGAPLADLAYEDFALTEIQRLEELRLVATEERIEAELALGRHHALVPELERLAQTYVLRERLRAQLMLALYRSGRHAEALRVYGETRKQLIAELGIEPSQQLRDLEQAILRQDPALEVRRPSVATKRRALVGTLALALAAAATALLVALTQGGGTETARALAAAESNVLVSARRGDVVRDVPIRGTKLVRFGAGSLWSLSSDGELVRLDPKTGGVIATIGLGVEPSGIAFGAGSLWVTGRHSPILFRIDPSVNEIVDRFRLPMKGVITDLTGDVAIGAGSVWVGHGAYNPGAWVERLDPDTGRVQRRFSILAGDVDHLAFGAGALWVASTPSGELRKIDPRTNNVVLTRRLQPELCCTAVGGGYVWAATNPGGDVWKLTSEGTLLRTIELSSAVEQLTYAQGALWATLGGSGNVVRIDPTTSSIRRYHVGHLLTGLDVHGDLVAVGVRESAEDATADLDGDIVWVGRKGGTLFDSGAASDPAFTAPTWDAPQLQFHYATCARLLNYRDAAGEAGKRLVPDAADLPQVSDDARTYTFQVRPGFRFSPPSNEEVTPESFRHAIERALSPKFDYVAPEASNIVGVDQYRAGKVNHISGVSVEGRKLVIRLYRPAPNFLWLAAQSCAVPRGTPVVRDGLETPVASAGPYYLAEHTDSFAVLRRNPNYGGRRPQHLDAIVFKFNVAAGEAASQIENDSLDYFLESQSPTLTPNTAAARAAGARYRVTPSSSAGVQFFAFNVQRPLFSEIRMRRAVQFALNRVALARAGDGVGIPATRLLSPGVLGYDGRPLYPPQGDVARARRLVGGRRSRAVVYTWVDPPYTDAFNRLLRQQLAAIGTRMSLIRIDQTKGFELSKARRADLIWGGLSANTPDAAAYLKPLSHLPPAYSNEIARIQLLFPPARERAAVSLVRRIERQSLFAVYVTDAMPELVSRRLGCIIDHPVYAGIDLAALCIHHGKA